MKWYDESVTEYKYSNHSKEEVVEILKEDIHERNILETWSEDKNGKQIAYFDKHIQLITGEEEMKKATKEEVLNEVDYDIWVQIRDIKEVLDSLEEKGYIKFKKETKEYKVFVKIVTIGREKKKLYYVSSYHLSENIDEAKRFETNEDKDGYVPEIVKESSNEF
jgi:DNA-binding MarR family transcriptional regulator